MQLPNPPARSSSKSKVQSLPQICHRTPASPADEMAANAGTLGEDSAVPKTAPTGAKSEESTAKGDANGELTIAELTDDAAPVEPMSPARDLSEAELYRNQLQAMQKDYFESLEKNRELSEELESYRSGEGAATAAAGSSEGDWKMVLLTSVCHASTCDTGCVTVPFCAPGTAALKEIHKKKMEEAKRLIHALKKKVLLLTLNACRH